MSQVKLNIPFTSWKHVSPPPRLGNCSGLRSNVHRVLHSRSLRTFSFLFAMISTILTSKSMNYFPIFTLWMNLLLYHVSCLWDASIPLCTVQDSYFMLIGEHFFHCKSAAPAHYPFHYWWTFGESHKRRLWVVLLWIFLCLSLGK